MVAEQSGDEDPSELEQLREEELRYRSIALVKRRPDLGDLLLRAKTEGKSWLEAYREMVVKGRQNPQTSEGDERRPRENPSSDATGHQPK